MHESLANLSLQGITVPREDWYWPTAQTVDEEDGQKEEEGQEEEEIVDLTVSLTFFAIKYIQYVYSIAKISVFVKLIYERFNLKCLICTFLSQPADKLQILTSYLRGIHFYCIWCGTTYDGTCDNLIYV